MEEQQKPKVQRRTLEEREEALEQKLEDLKRTRKNRKIMKFWKSAEIRNKKSELQKNKEIDYKTRLQELLNFVYQETGIITQVPCETDEIEQEETEEEEIKQ